MEEIKVKYFVDGIDELCYVAGKSDWIDLHAAVDVDMKAGEFRLIPLSGYRCAASWCACIRSWAPPLSTSPMTRWRP